MNSTSTYIMAAFSDDYVASILQRDADKKSTSNLSSLFSSVGSVTRATKPRSAAPKPNARFLRNLVRDVDSHNAALKEKEERESRRRMWDLQRGKKGERPERVKRKVEVEAEDDDGKEAGSKRRRRSLERYAPGSARHGRAKDGSPTARERKHHHHRSENRRQERDKERSRSRSPDRERKHHHHHHHHHHHRSKRSREHERDKARARSRSPDRSHHSSIRRRRDVQKEEEEEEEEEQSSSEAEIGPELPARGRGSQHASILDRPEEAERWKTTRPEVVVEEDIANVKWTAMGQKREWDRGKEQDPFNIKSDSEEPEEMWPGRLK